MRLLLTDRAQMREHYPDSVGADDHITGLILAGAFWDLRTLTSRQTALELMHFAMYGLPDDLDDGIAFSEWYVETLVADDNDGNLANGTPHFPQINQAFNRHRIGSGLFLALSTSHVPPPDPQDPVHSYPVTVSVRGITPSYFPDSVRVCYSTDAFKTKRSIQATRLDTAFRAEIPPQAAGTVVNYYFEVTDPLDKQTVNIPVGAPADRCYSFVTGVKRLHLDDFEKTSPWSVAAPDANSSWVQWEWGSPAPTMIGPGVLYQPAGDHTSGKGRCYVTGAAAGSGYSDNAVSDGRTTLFSPSFDLRQVVSPIVRYYKWSQNISYFDSYEPWRVEVSADAGRSWMAVESDRFATHGWEKRQFAVLNYVSTLDSIRFRFTVNSKRSSYSAIEGLLDDFEILGVSGTVGLPRQPKIEVNTSTLSLGLVSDTISRLDTTFLVTNNGYGVDSLSVTLDSVTVKDPAFAISPTAFTLAGGDSQRVTFSVVPRLLSAGRIYRAMVLIDSRFGVGKTHFEKQFLLRLTSVEEPAVPTAFVLEQNYPNPFNPSTSITYQLPASNHVTLIVYDLLGREVATLVDENKPAGVHDVQFDAQGLTSGIYLYRMQAGSFVDVKKLVVLK